MTKTNGEIRTSYLTLLTVTAALGGLLFGFDIAIITGAGPFVQQHFGLNELQLGWGFSSLLFGCIIGSAIAGRVTDIFGRRKILLGVAVLFAVTSAGTALAGNFAIFAAVRLLGGLAVGAASVVSPMYISEVSPSHVRGRLVAAYQLSIVIGVLASYSTNYLLRGVGPANWRWMFLTGVAPSVAFLLLLFLVPETPRFLFKAGREAEAGEVLRKIGGAEYAAREMAQIRGSLDRSEKRVPRFVAAGTAKTSARGIRARRACPDVGDQHDHRLRADHLQIGRVEDRRGPVLHLHHRVGELRLHPGIAAGDRPVRPQTPLPGRVRRHDRHPGASRVRQCHPPLHGNPRPAAHPGVHRFFCRLHRPGLLDIALRNLSQQNQGTAMSVPVFTQWTVNALIVWLFPWVFRHLGGAVTFGFLALMALLQLIFTWAFVPETKNKSLEEIEKAWRA